MPNHLKLSARTQFPDELNTQGLLPASGVPCRVKAVRRTKDQAKRLKTDSQTAAPNVSTAVWPGWLPLFVLPASTILFRNHVRVALHVDAVFRDLSRT